jgi:hypothetical protein
MASRQLVVPPPRPSPYASLGVRPTRLRSERVADACRTACRTGKLTRVHGPQVMTYLSFFAALEAFAVLCATGEGGGMRASRSRAQGAEQRSLAGLQEPRLGLPAGSPSCAAVTAARQQTCSPGEASPASGMPGGTGSEGGLARRCASGWVRGSQRRGLRGQGQPAPC